MNKTLVQIYKQDKKIQFIENEVDYLNFCVKSNVLEQKKEIEEKIKKKKEELQMCKDKINDLMNKIQKESLDEYLNEIKFDDCRNHLLRLPEESIDLLLSDIPYGINLDEWDVIHNNTNSALLGQSPAQKGKKAFKKRGKPINGWNKDDRNINEEYRNWVYKWARLVFPIMKEGAPLFIFGGRRTISDAVVALEEAGFLVKDILAWKKSSAHHRRQDIFKVLVKRGSKYSITDQSINKYKKIDGLNDLIDKLLPLKGEVFNNYRPLLNRLKEIDNKLHRKYRYEIMEYALQDKETSGLVKKWKGWKLGNLAPIYEPIVWLFKPYNTTTLTDNVLKNEVGAMNLNVCKINGKSPTNMLEFDFTKEETNNKLHEAQKPIDLIKYLIKLTTKENQVILDPFVGSGTTAVAAKELNRKFIAFEKNEEHYENAIERLKGVSGYIQKQINLGK